MDGGNTNQSRMKKSPTKKTKKCQPPTRDMADLIQTVHVPSWGLARPHKKIKKPKKPKMDGGNTTQSHMKNSPTKITKKCQPSAGDMADLIQTGHVPSRRLTRPQKKITERKKSKQTKLNSHEKTTKSCKIENCPTKKTKKCQPSAGDMADLIQTGHVPNRGLTRPHKKITERKNSKQTKINSHGKTIKSCQTNGHQKTKKQINKQQHILNGNVIKMKLITWNKGPALAKNRIPEIHQLLLEQKPTVLAIQEFNLREVDDETDLHFPEYSLEMDTMMAVHGWSRSAIYIHNSVKHSRRLDLEVTTEAMVAITLHPARTKPINIINYYRQWQVCQSQGAVPDTDSINEQTKRLKAISEKIKKSITEQDTVTLSDTNLDFSIDWAHPSTMPPRARNYNPLYRIYREELFNNGLTVIKTAPTKHYLNQPDTTIDHLMTTTPNKIISHQVLHNYSSDHYPVTFTWSSKGQKSGIKYLVTRKFKNINWEEIRANLLNDNRLVEATLSTGPSEIYSLISEAIQDSLQEQAPPQKIQIKQKLPQFLSTDTIELIKKRDEAYKAAKNTGDIDQSRLYKNLRNRVRKMMTSDKSQSIKQKMEEVKGDPKKEWKEAKDILGWKPAGSPAVLSVQGKTVTKSTDIADSINFAILSKTRTIQRNISPTNTDPLQNYRKLMDGKRCSFSLQNITMPQLNKLMLEIHPGSSASFDLISMKTIKKIYPAIKQPLLNLVNATISTTTYPTGLKISKVLPLLKKDKIKTDPQSYRGINILPSLGKIVDKIVSQQISTYLDQNNLIPPNHHGGRKFKSTITAATTLVDEWADDLENNAHKAILLLDQSAAFDTICHKILVQKLQILGFDNHSLQYMESYLSNRSQIVQIDGAQSNELHTGPYSVVQGSTLSCLLYLLYTLDLPAVYHQTNPTIEHQTMCPQPTPTTFVDDTIVKVDIQDPATRQQVVMQSLLKMKDYMDSNKLALNPEKTKLFVLTKNPEIREQVFLEVQPKRILHSPTIQYLGISISQDLKWNEFLINNKNSLSKQLTKRINAIKKLRNYVDFQQLKVIATGIFMSKFHYGMEMWAGAPTYLKKKMQSVQLSAARAAIGYKAYYWSTDKLLQKMGWLPIEKLLTLYTVKLAHQILQVSIPEVISYKIKKQIISNPVLTRLSGPNKFGPRPKIFGRTTYTKYQFKANLFSQYPKIHDKILEIKSKKRFGHWAKKFLFNPKKIPTVTKKK